jgi:hypothetical protein
LLLPVTLRHKLVDAICAALRQERQAADVRCPEREVSGHHVAVDSGAAAFAPNWVVSPSAMRWRVEHGG